MLLPNVENDIRAKLAIILTPLCQEDNYGQREDDPSQAINEIVALIDWMSSMGFLESED